MKPSLFFVVLDDDPSVLGMLRRVFKGSGHEIAGRSPRGDFLEGIASDQLDCFLLVHKADGPDVMDLCRRIKSREGFEKSKVIVIGESDDVTLRCAALSAGADGYAAGTVDKSAFTRELEEIIADEVKLTFWGVRGTLPVPGEGSLRYGGNTSCVTLEFPAGQFFIFDAGTGIKVLSDHLVRQGRRRLAGRLFISHPHLDHIHALPFFAPLYAEGSMIEIIGAAQADASVRDFISAQMDGVYFPIEIREFAADISFRDVAEGGFEIDGLEVKAMRLSHPGTCFGYRVHYKGRSVCYITDNELYPEHTGYHRPDYVEQLTEFVAGADALITDSTYSDEEYAKKINWGHSCISEVVDLADRAGVKTLYLFHHDPDQSDDAIDAKLGAARQSLIDRGSSTQCLAPWEGLTVRI